MFFQHCASMANKVDALPPEGGGFDLRLKSMVPAEASRGSRLKRA